MKMRTRDSRIVIAIACSDGTQPVDELAEALRAALPAPDVRP